MMCGETAVSRMRPDLFVNVLLPSRVPSNPRLPVLLLCVVVAGSRPREACVALFPSHHANIHEKYHRLDAIVYTATIHSRLVGHLSLAIPHSPLAK